VQNIAVVKDDLDVYPTGGLRYDGRILCDQGKEVLCDGTIICDGTYSGYDGHYYRDEILQEVE
jgi:hypothetical protein